MLTTTLSAITRRIAAASPRQNASRGRALALGRNWSVERVVRKDGSAVWRVRWRQAGHAPTVALDTYAHVFEEFDPGERVNAADRIRKAREELRFRSQQPTLFDVA